MAFRGAAARSAVSLGNKSSFRVESSVERRRGESESKGIQCGKKKLRMFEICICVSLLVLLVGGGLWIWAQHSASQQYGAMKHTRSNIPVNSKSWNDSKNDQELGGGTKVQNGETGDEMVPVKGGSESGEVDDEIGTVKGGSESGETNDDKGPEKDDSGVLMAVQVDNRRENIKASLVAEAEKYLADFDSYREVLVEEPDNNYIAKQTYNEDDIAVIVSKIRCEGLTVELLVPKLDNMAQTMADLNDKASLESLEEQQGYRIAHLRFHMPWFVSNRSIIICQYTGETADGWTYRLTSSQGNEAEVEALSDAIGGDVVGFLDIGYVAYKPYEGGVEMEQIACLDLAGSIPDMVKNAVAKKQEYYLRDLCAYAKESNDP